MISVGKNYNGLFELKYQDLIWRIVEGTRRAARVIPEFRNNTNGCIRITIVPLSELADTWLGGGLSDFGVYREVNARDVCEREFVYKLFPEGSHTMQFQCEDGHVEPVNCYGYSALKVAYASWKRRFDEWVQQNNIPEEIEAHEFQKQTEYFVAENGYSLDKGVIYTTVKLDGEDFLRLYVTVSGAQLGETDLQCAAAGLLAAQNYFLIVKNQFEDPIIPQWAFQLVPRI